MLEKHFGDKLVHFDGEHSMDVLHHMENHMSANDHQELFNAAYHHGKVNFQVRMPDSGQFKDVTLVHKDGKYSISL